MDRNKKTVQVLEKDDEDGVISMRKLLQKYSAELGFHPTNPSVEKGEVLIIKQKDIVVACLIFHQRKDGVTSIYDLVVDESMRGQGLAKELLRALIEAGHDLIQLKCPEELPSNYFYARYGALVAVEPGKKRRLNNWWITKQTFEKGCTNGKRRRT